MSMQHTNKQNAYHFHSKSAKKICSAKTQILFYTIIEKYTRYFSIVSFALALSAIESNSNGLFLDNPQTINSTSDPHVEWFIINRSKFGVSTPRVMCIVYKYVKPKQQQQLNGLWRQQQQKQYQATT